MSTVINKTTFEVLKSVNTPDYPESEWIINPSEDVIKSMGLLKQARDKAIQDEKAPYMIKSKTQIMSELWAHMTPILVDVKGKRRVGDMSSMTMELEDYVIIPKDSPEIVQEKTQRRARWANATLTPSFQMMSLQLNGNDYTNARARGKELVATMVITQADYDILDSILPKVR